MFNPHSVSVTDFARVLMEKLCFCNIYEFCFITFTKKILILLVFNNYLCIWSSLFQYVLNPTFSNEHIASLDSSSKLSRAYDGTTYLPGMSLTSILNAQQFKNKIMWKETKSLRNLIIYLISGIVGLNNIKENDYCNVILQVCKSDLLIGLSLIYNF